MKDFIKNISGRPVLLCNGFIADGTGRRGYVGDVLIDRGRIADVNKAGKTSRQGCLAIDLKEKKVICPGFIDMHGHTDLAPYAVPLMDSKLTQGVASEVTGNCGLTPAPASARNRAHLEDSYRAGGLLGRWKNFGSYLKDMEKKRPCLNIIPLAGQGTVHSFYLAYKDVPVSAGIIKKMKAKARESLRQGAWGISFGLIYPPGCFLKDKEKRAFFEAARAEGCFTVAHMRSEGDRVEEALREMMEAACAVGVPFHASHLKTSGRKNWHKLAGLLRAIEGARRKGFRVTADRYPYTASWTDLDTILPDFVFANGHEAEIRLLASPDGRRRVKEIFFKDEDRRRGTYFDFIAVSGVRKKENKIYEGKSLTLLGRMMKKEPFEAACDLLVKERLNVSAIFFTMSEENMEEILLRPYTVVGSDSSAKTFDARREGKPHPRAYGTFPRFFSMFAKSGKMTVEQAVRKCTGLSADIIGLGDRGYLKKGFAADITVFDPERIRDRATYMHPVARSEGIEHVIINGKFALFEGEITGERNGHVVFRK